MIFRAIWIFLFLATWIGLSNQLSIVKPVANILKPRKSPNFSSTFSFLNPVEASMKLPGILSTSERSTTMSFFKLVSILNL